MRKYLEFTWSTCQYVVLLMHFLVSIHRSYTTIKKKSDKKFVLDNWTLMIIIYYDFHIHYKG